MHLSNHDGMFRNGNEAETRKIVSWRCSHHHRSWEIFVEMVTSLLYTGSSYRLRDGSVMVGFVLHKNIRGLPLSGCWNCTIPHDQMPAQQRFSCTSHRTEVQAGCSPLNARNEEDKGSIWPSILFPIKLFEMLTPQSLHTLMARLKLCQLVDSGADTTTIRIEWIERLSRGCRSAQFGDQNYASLSIRAHTLLEVQSKNSPK